MNSSQLHLESLIKGRFIKIPMEDKGKNINFRNEEEEYIP